MVPQGQLQSFDERVVFRFLNLHGTDHFGDVSNDLHRRGRSRLLPQDRSDRGITRRLRLTGVGVQNQPASLPWTLLSASISERSCESNRSPAIPPRLSLQEHLRTLAQPEVRTPDPA